MIDNFRNFIYWESASRDTIDFKKIYVDMTGDLLAGLLLSQIIFWHLPNKSGDSKLRIEKQGHLWIAKSHDEWYEEIRFTRKNFDTAIKKLVQLKLVEKRIYKFNGTPTIHIRLIEDMFLNLWTNEIEGKQEKTAPALDLTESGKSEILAVKPEKSAPALDLTESGKSICPNGANPFDRIGQIFNRDNNIDLKTEEEEEDMRVRADVSDVPSSEIENRFKTLIQKNKISPKIAEKILEAIGDINTYEIEALEMTFKKAMTRIKRGTIGTIPKWFAGTLLNDNETIKIQNIERDERLAMERRLGMHSDER